MGSSKLCFSLKASSMIRSNIRLVGSVCSSVYGWPEWVRFVHRLKSKGYFPDSTDTHQIHLNSLSHTDSALINYAALSFATHRSELFASLSLRDIQTLVQKGCPSLYPKVVDSAKRLRAHFQLDEIEVCGACNQRGRCNKYLEILDDHEASPRTTDVVRILLRYALDSSALSEVIATDRAIIEKSVRRLFSQLIVLSDALPGPEIRITSVPAPRVKKKPVEFDENDWRCSRCSFMNFARNIQCMKCQGDGPNEDWICPGCSYLNSRRNINCKKCNSYRPGIARTFS